MEGMDKVKYSKFGLMYFKDAGISSPQSQEKHAAKCNTEQNPLLTPTPKLLFFFGIYLGNLPRVFIRP